MADNTLHSSAHKEAGWSAVLPCAARQHATYRMPGGITGFLAAAYLLVVIPGCWRRVDG
jgi:hypothetical protein